jgi:thiamine pyrophosphokinase
VERYTGRTIILSGGEPLENINAFTVPDHDWVIAADSGLHHADGLGLAVDLVIGDMDSVDADALESAIEHGSATDRHPVDKDSTDLELAIDAALAHGARAITIIGSYAGRLDHLLGAMGLFAATVPAVDELVWSDGSTDVTGCSSGGTVVLNGRVGDRVSLVPAGMDVRGVATTGLRWNLGEATLRAGSTRGVSNVIESAPARVSVGEGTLLVVHERSTT